MGMNINPNLRFGLIDKGKIALKYKKGEREYVVPAKVWELEDKEIPQYKKVLLDWFKKRPSAVTAIYLSIHMPPKSCLYCRLFNLKNTRMLVLQ